MRKAELYTLGNDLIGEINIDQESDEKGVKSIEGTWIGMCNIVSPIQYNEILIKIENNNYKGCFTSIAGGPNCNVGIKCTRY